MPQVKGVAMTRANPSLLYVAYPFSALLFVFTLFIFVWPGPDFVCGARRAFVPSVADAPVLPTAADPLPTVSVLEDGTVFLDSKWFPDPELPAGLREYRSLHGPTIVISADRRLSVGHVKRVLQLASASGFSRLILAAESPLRRPSILQYLIDASPANPKVRRALPNMPLQPTGTRAPVGVSTRRGRVRASG